MSCLTACYMAIPLVTNSNMPGSLIVSLIRICDAVCSFSVCGVGDGVLQLPNVAIHRLQQLPNAPPPASPRQVVTEIHALEGQVTTVAAPSGHATLGRRGEDEAAAARRRRWPG